ncbi:MAG TPA: 5'/3'-nucleotidase SurE [Phycisphaerae bacterium]|nr:5'/3'-nucleotidase SurE [Phycisphaerae bacterium]
MPLGCGTCEPVDNATSPAAHGHGRETAQARACVSNDLILSRIRYNAAMRILLTNDDGILAPGIEALYKAVADLGTVDVVAPETAQSAIGHAITVHSPMAAHRVNVKGVFEGWSVDGRPADCVKLAVLELLEWKPDFVLSGINQGVNTGINVLYSGTVAGAAEGAFFGVPSMAISLELSDKLDFQRAGKIAREIFERYVAAGPPPGACLNVNIPALDAGWPRGVRVCPQGTVPMNDSYHKQIDPRGRPVFWLDGAMPDREACPDSDVAAVMEGYVVITPLRFDVTDRELLPTVAKWDWPQEFA